MRRRKSLKNSFKNAYKGLMQAVFKQSHMFYLTLIVIFLIILFLHLRITYIEWLILFVALSLPIIAELFNTAFEIIVDHLSPYYNPSVKLAKDISAGAVLTALTVCALVSGVILLHRLTRPAPHLTPMEDYLVKLVSGLFLLFAALGVSKASFLKGGVSDGLIDGKTAFISFLVVSLLFLTNNLPILLFIFFVGIIFTLLELGHPNRLLKASIGALLGVLISLFLFLVV
ncbi:diacylglycerol kinase [bacterium]|nr:diacylglycerol kinase [bacterium]